MDARIDSLVVIGGGKMGGALVSGWLGCSEGPAASLRPDNVTVVNPGEQRRRFLEDAYGVSCVADSSDAPRADVVVLAVKPQVMFDVLEVVRANPALGGGAGGPLFVSIAAGLPCSRLLEGLPEGARLVRVMPNMPLALGAGASAVCGAPGTPSEDVDLVVGLFGSLGRAVVADETCMDAVCALSGSGPAYVALFIEALRDAGVNEGLDREVAEALAIETVYGTALQIRETDQSAEQVRESICSPGGTTLAALGSFEETGFVPSIEAAVHAAVVRSKELSEC